MDTQIEKLTQLGSEAVRDAISHYTAWFIVSAICWLLLAAILFAVATVLVREAKARFSRDRDEALKLIFFAVLIAAVAAIITAANLPDLIQPQAKAIHQLLKDASGGKLF